MRKIFLLVIMVLLFSTVADAKYKEIFKVDYDILWSTTVRFIRVDMDWAIVDKDKDNGYIIFTYKSKSGTESRGSVEFVKRVLGKDDKRESYDLLVNIDKVSNVDERMVVADLKKKLHSER